MDKKMNSFKKGLMLTAISKYSVVIMQVLVLSILSRFLTPKDFGEVSIIMVFLVFFSFLASSGISSAIVQKKELKEIDINTIFLFTLIWGILLAIFYYFFSLFLDIFYENESFSSTAFWLGLILFFTSLTSVPEGLLRKNMKFRELGLTEIYANLFSSIVAIILAIKGFGIYSIIMQSFFRAILVFMGYFYFSKFRMKLSFCKDNIYSVIVYSFHDLFTNIINYFSRSLDNLLIGKLLGLNILGFYDRAYRLMLFPLKNLSLVITPVLHPIISDDNISEKGVYLVYKKVIKVLAIIGLPITVYLYINAKGIIRFVYGPNWSESVVIFKLLSISIFPQLILTVLKSFYLVSEKVKEMTKINIIGNVIIVISIISGILLGDVYKISIFISIAYIIRTLIEMVYLNLIYFKNKLSDLYISIQYSLYVSVVLIPVFYCFVERFSFQVSILINLFFLVLGFISILFINKDFEKLINIIRRRK